MFILWKIARGGVWRGGVWSGRERYGERDEIYINETRVMLALEREREVIRRDVTSLVNLRGVLVLNVVCFECVLCFGGCQGMVFSMMKETRTTFL